MSERAPLAVAPSGVARNRRPTSEMTQIEQLHSVSPVRSRCNSDALQSQFLGEYESRRSMSRSDAASITKSFIVNTRTRTDYLLLDPFYRENKSLLFVNEQWNSDIDAGPEILRS
ncbi:unnamed protein product [Leptosia nina]|uniref:Uncharacterized protein n=1 Tax=Leptosia nina TaxID=320188 RepID=A0AAV1JTT2_9NEOP